MMPRRLLILLLPLMMGCNLLQLTPTSQVIRTRVAGIKADPAEIGVGESSILSALVVHPEQPAPEFGQIWFSCLAAGGATGCLGVDVVDVEDLDGEDFDPTSLQFGVGDTFTYSATGPILEEAWAELEPEDRVEGLVVLVSVNLVRKSNDELQAMLFELVTAFQNEDTETAEAIGAEFGSLVENGISAARRVVVSDKTADEPDAIACPAEELAPNTNPEITGLLLHLDAEGKDAGFPVGSVIFAEPGATLTLRPIVSGTTIEDYLYITRFDETECRREAPWFGWLTNGGSLDGDYSFIADAGDLDEVAGRPKINALRLPPEEFFGESIDLWMVIRDRRGGLDWNHWTLLPERAP
ncbi:MAG: hypothetical protein GY898_09590 [Proteobacteria bacterium]|nr:hypothetical protein [Pseudomonadota bacterium]